MGIDDLLPPKRRRSPKVMRHAERNQGLSKTQQRFVISTIDVLKDSRCRIFPVEGRRQVPWWGGG